MRSIVNNIQNYDKSDYIINDTIIYNLINKKNKLLNLNNILLNCDIHKFLFIFFNYIYNNYVVDDHTVYMMKLLLIVNNDKNYIVNEFIPYINIKLNLRT